jgi:GntR family transcriptional regulator
MRTNRSGNHRRQLFEAMDATGRSLSNYMVRGRRRTPAVRRVRELLRVTIVQHLLRGDVLPSEWELVSSYRTTRGVVREALDLLRSEGLIDRLQGAGTFVIAPERQIIPIEEVGGMVRHMDDGDARVRWELLEYETVPAPPLIAERLQVPEGSEVVYAERRQMLDGEPVVLRSSWMPSEVGDIFMADPAAARRSVYDLVEKALGRPISRADLRIEATLADSSTTTALGLAEGAPVMLLERLVFDVTDRPVEYGHSRLRADRAAMTTTMRRVPADEPDRPVTRNALAVHPRMRKRVACSQERWSLLRRPSPAARQAT